ncbi:hypothetical protein GCM10011340_20170 [Roseivirga thermotolerans]|uniref:Uncharacterized protein n=2 Tax=Roseivirga thermotolerans TaxID=1758176 RepID=A0ABQ3I997_9BACT|nr:hypothetical protein GCM10011340_20170 [Roseivirga thermotolerans]
MSENSKRKLGAPLMLRPFEDQRERFEEFATKENKRLVNEGNKPKTDSDHARFIFEQGLEQLGYELSSPYQGEVAQPVGSESEVSNG